MTGRYLLDLTHTSHTRARTGIQRVTRALYRELGAAAMPVTHDPYLRSWRPLAGWELANLATETVAAKRSVRWPWSARWRGHWRRATGRSGTFVPPPDCAGLIVPELFSPVVGADLPRVFPRVAVFHDAIALRFPELTPAGTVTRAPAYLRELLDFDGVAAVSEDSRDALLDYWRWLGVARTPPVIALPLGVDPVAAAPAIARDSEASPVILCVGTLEGRKNHVALLDACEQLWTAGATFRLRLVGAAQAQTGHTALERVRALQTSGRPLRYDGPLSDHDVAVAYASCAFTVYPSLAEGFGLPVIESLARGRPCVCSGRGALGELSRRGGCVALEAVDAASLASAIRRLLDSPDELSRLSDAARARTFKTWGTYAQELTAWMKTLSQNREPAARSPK